ncbi:MAG: hypothetical protein LBQ51_02425 [Desulfovibrio sp.]|nr:hypothetical protein [Desulfovibrio sp.]
MKYTLYLVMPCFVLMLAGCGVAYDPLAHDIEKLDTDKTFFVMRSNNGKAGITTEAKTEETFDGVPVQTAYSFTAAVYKEVSHLSASFSTPEELPHEASEMARSLPTKVLGLSFFTKDGKQYVLSTPSWVFLDGKEINKHPYYSLTEVVFSCTRDSEQVCARKMSDVSVQALLPVIKKFITEQRY